MVEMASRMMRLGVFATSAAALSWIPAAPAVADSKAGQVTAAIDADLAGPIADGEHVQLGEEAACSILLDDDAVVELCGKTSLVFERDRDSKRRIISLDSGELRVVVEPRDFEERIEIHTPAAIATLLGTIVHVSVDPQTGATIISSAESKVSVRSDEPDVRGTTVLTAGEQVTVEPGEAPPMTPTRLDAREISELGGCLVNFHSAAADRDSRDRGDRLTDQLAASDAANAASLPAATDSDRPAGSPLDAPGDPIAGQEDVCVTTDCEPQYDPDSGKDPLGLQNLEQAN